LTSLGLLGLPFDFDARASQARQRASQQELAALARQYFSPGEASFIVVGPVGQIGPQLGDLGLPPGEPWSPEGRPLDR
jgi:hypothetical protein